MVMVSKRLLKLYYRDSNKVMRALPGIEYAPNTKSIFIHRSVYTQTRKDDWDYLFQVKKK